MSSAVVGCTVCDVNSFYHKDIEILRSAKDVSLACGNEEITKLFNNVLLLHEQLVRFAENDTIVDNARRSRLRTDMVDLQEKASIYIPRKERSIEPEQPEQPEPSRWEKAVPAIKYIAAAFFFLVGVAAIGFGVVSILAAPGVGIASGAFLTTFGMGALTGSAVIGTGAGVIAAGLLSGIGGGALLRSLRGPDEVINCATAHNCHPHQKQLDLIRKKIQVLPISKQEVERLNKRHINLEVAWSMAMHNPEGETFSIPHSFIKELNALEDDIDVKMREKR